MRRFKRRELFFVKRVVKKPKESFEFRQGRQTKVDLACRVKL